MVDEKNSENGAGEDPEFHLEDGEGEIEETQPEEAGGKWESPGNELGDFGFGLESFESIATETRPARSRMPLVLALVLAIVALGAYIGFFRGRDEVAPVSIGETAPEPEPQRSSEGEQTKAAFELPSLGASDGVLRRMIGQLTSHPEFIRWTFSNNLIRSFAAAVENVANGVSPSSHIKQITIGGAFEATQVGERFFINPQSYARYNEIAAVIDSIDASGAAALYSSFKPLLDEVYQDLGYPGGDFDELLQRAMARLVSTPVITGQVDLVQKVSSYEFADEDVEGLQAVQKQLLRSGPENQRVIQGKIREIARELGFSL